jgi:hypothetical protein
VICLTFLQKNWLILPPNELLNPPPNDLLDVPLNQQLDDHANYQLNLPPNDPLDLIPDDLSDLTVNQSNLLVGEMPQNISGELPNSAVTRPTGYNPPDLPAEVQEQAGQPAGAPVVLTCGTAARLHFHNSGLPNQSSYKAEDLCGAACLLFVTMFGALSCMFFLS